MKSAARNLIAMTLAGMALGLAVPVVAQDVTDNETCMECHADTDRAAPADPNMVQVHNPEGGFFQEAHEMWSCVDCHTGVEEIPHAEEIEAVDCLNCHEEVPSN
jgi:hypothetical protein